MFGNNVEVVAVNFEIRRLNHDFVKFNCGDSTIGIIHVPDQGDLTVILEGGYILGVYDCINCTVDAISDVHCEVFAAEKNYGMDYAAYKKVFQSAASSAKLH